VNATDLDGDVDAVPVVLSGHARQRIDEMSVDETEVINAIREAEITQPTPAGPGRRVAIKGRLRVVYARHPTETSVITVVWQNRYARSDGPMTPVPNQPSNRSVHDKMILWGCTPGRRRGDYLQMRTPTGELIEVRPPGIGGTNSSRTLSEVYRLLRVSAEVFWNRTEKVRPPRERIHATPSALTPPADPPPKPKEIDMSAVPSNPTSPAAPEPPPLSSHTGRVLAYFRAHPGVVVPLADLRRPLGLDAKQIQNSAAFLARDGHLQRAGRGEYKYLRWGESDAAKAQAQKDLAWVTDPANRPGPTPPKPRVKQPNAASARILAYFAARPGQGFTARQAADALDLEYKQVSNSVQAHHRAGRLRRGEHTGEYLFPATGDAGPVDPVDAITDPLAKLDAIQQRLNATAEQEDPPMPPPALTVAANNTPEVDPNAYVAKRTVTPVVHASLDDEIDALLELLVPGGLKARHLRLGAEVCDAIRRLLEATRPQLQAGPDR
jgi:hypothetical protein